MTSEMFIERYPADLSAELSSLITFELDNVKDFSARSTSWSKTIVLPGTSRNNKIFGHIFEVGQSNAYDSTQRNVNYNFNASKAANVIIFQDQIQMFKGVLRLLQINIIQGRMEYEVGVWGEISSLNSFLTGKFLSDLDFSAYDHTYNTTNIINSWDNAGGSGYYYPLIDYGAASQLKHNWDFTTFRPALYVKEYIDKMFEAAGFRYSSDLFETNRFKKLIVPHNQKKLTKLSSDQLNANRLIDLEILSDTGGIDEMFPFENVNITGNFTSTIGNSRITYTGTDPLTVRITSAMRGQRYSTVTGYTLQILKNGVLIPGIYTQYSNNGSTTYVPWEWLEDFTIQLSNGDYLEWRFFADDSPHDPTFSMTVEDAIVYIYSSIPTIVQVPYSGSVIINDTIPKNVSQVEFLLSIIRLFNLYIYEDTLDDRLIHITPYVDFYSTSATDAVDWTYKLNRDKVIKIRPMSEINAKKYNFKYKSDGDYYNDLYRKRYNEGYGDYVFNSEFDFAKQDETIDLIFSATPLVGYTGEEKIYSTIMKITSGVEENVDSNIRILQTKKITGVASWNILNGVTVLASTTDYGYAGHFDDPDAPSDDLNFGNLRELFFVLVTGDLTRTQFNVYWSAYMAEITDKDSKLMDCWVYLNASDIFALDFSKKVYIDGILFRLNSVKDYNATRPSDCAVELLKINYLIY